MVDSGCRPQCLDFEYYISQQILPPIERLCDLLTETNRSRLAECLALEPSRFGSHVGREADDRGFSTVKFQMLDHIRSKDWQMLIMILRYQQKGYIALNRSITELVTEVFRRAQQKEQSA